MMLLTLRWRFVLPLLLLLAYSGATVATAQPSLKAIDPTGLKIGATTRVKLVGEGLNDSLRVLLIDQSATDCPIEIHSIDGQQADLSITLSNDFQSGLHGLRVVTRDGISNPLSICLDHGTLVLQPHDVQQESAAELPVSLSGIISGDQRLHFDFHANEGEVVVVEAWAKRLGSDLRPVLRILDEHDQQVAWQVPQPRLSQDTLLAWKPQATGTYRLELHDVTYRAPNNAKFYVSLSTSPLRDSVFPFSSRLESAFHGQLQTLYPIQSREDGRATQWLPEKVAIAFDAQVPGWYRVGRALPDAEMQGNPRLWLDTLPEYQEREHAADAEQVIDSIPAPLNIHGTLMPDEQRDVFRIGVTRQQRLRCEVWAERMGSPLDGVLVVRDQDGKELGRSDDRAGTTDPEVVITVPEGSKTLTLELSDLTHSAGRRYQYRIAVNDISAGEIQARVAINAVSVFTPGDAVIPVAIGREACNLPIEFEVFDLPEGWRAIASTISGSANRGLVRLTRIHGNAQPGTFSIACRPAGHPQLTTFATFDLPTPVSKNSPWLSRFIGVATHPAYGIVSFAPLLIDPDSHVHAYKGGELRLPLTWIAEEVEEKERDIPNDATYRIRMLTSQQPIKKTMKVDNKDQVVDDLERMIRLIGETNVSLEREAHVNIAFPPDLPADEWECLLITEVVQGDGNQVLSRNTSTPMIVDVRQAFQVVLPALDKPLEAVAGEALTITGNLERLNDFTGPVEITISGLPEGWSSETKIVETAEETFQLSIQVPAAQGAGAVTGITLQAKAYEAIEGGERRTIAASVPRTVALNVSAAEPNAPDKTNADQTERNQAIEN